MSGPQSANSVGEPAVAVHAIAAGDPPRAFLLGAGDHSLDPLALTFGNQRPDHVGRVRARTDLHVACERGDSRRQVVGDLLMDEQAAAANAVLARQQKTGHGHSGDGGRQVRIREHEHRGLSSQFQRDLFQVPRRP